MQEPKSLSLPSFYVFAIVASFFLLMAGCSGSRQARNVETSGFLSDYSLLKKGKGKEALLVYVNPDVEFSTYNKILMDPIVAYGGQDDSNFRRMSGETLQKHLDYFDAAIREQLKDNYEFVTEPGAGVMRFSIALTEAKSGKVALDTVSSVVPVGIALNALQTAVTGEGIGVGHATMEFEATDSVTSSLLAAAVDERVGLKYTGKLDKFDRWRATKSAFDSWAERLDSRLTELSSTTNQ